MNHLNLKQTMDQINLINVKSNKMELFLHIHYILTFAIHLFCHLESYTFNR